MVARPNRPAGAALPPLLFEQGSPTIFVKAHFDAEHKHTITLQSPLQIGH